MGPIAAAVGAVSGLVGANSSKNAQKAANGRAQSAADQQQALLQQLQQNTKNQTDQYDKYYSPAIPTLSSGLQSEAGMANTQLSQLLPQLLKAGLDPSIISKITGVDASQLTQQLAAYTSNPNGTNLAQAQPGAQSFYGNEAANGINPQFAANAQSQIQQGLAQQLADLRARQTPGQNVNAAEQQLQNNALTQQMNLAGNLAGKSQEFSNLGEQGLLQNAGNIDAQKLQMLLSGQQIGNGFNQQAYNNLGTSAASGQSILSALQNFIGQGQGQVNSAYGALTGGSNAAGNAQNSATQAAGQAGQGFASSIGGVASNLNSLFPGKTNQGSSGSSPVNTILPGMPDGSTGVFGY